MVVNTSEFDIESNTPPNLKIMIMDTFGITTPKVHTISQWIVKIIDFHNHIRFAMSTKSPELIGFKYTK